MGVDGKEGCGQAGGKEIPVGSSWEGTETREETGVLLGRKMGSESRAGLWVWRCRKPAREFRVNRAGQFEMEQVLLPVSCF